jgi:zinc and cadmium transporter
LNIIGDGIHNFLDGVAIASSFLISPEIGIATTIAVIFHEIPQEIADVSVLVYSGWNKARILVINFLTALTAMLGVVLVFVLTNFIEDLEKYLVPVAAGQFIYIALADLLPVIHRKAGVKKYIVEIAAFIIGLIIMFLLQSFEAE